MARFWRFLGKEGRKQGQERERPRPRQRPRQRRRGDGDGDGEGRRERESDRASTPHFLGEVKSCCCSHFTTRWMIDP